MHSKSNYGRVLFVTCLSTSLVPLMASALNLALPFINRDLSLSANMSGWVLTSYLLSTAIFQIPSARLADIFGRRKIFLCGIAVFFIFSVMSGLAHSGISLIIYRFLSGIGSALVFSTNLAILTAAVPASKRGWALGLNSGTVYLSLSIGPFLGGFLTQSFGWESIFFAAAFMSLIVFAGSLIVIKDEWKSDSGKSFDYPGAAIYAVGLCSLIYGFSILPHAAGFALAFAGAAVLAFFAVYERRLEHPVFNVNLFFGNRVFAFSSISALINYSATTSTAFMLSMYLQYVRGLTPIQAGGILITQTLIMMAATLQSGRLSDKISPSKLATGGMAMTSLGLALFCFLSESTSYVYIAGALFILGLGFGIFSAPNQNIIMSSVDAKSYGQAAAATGTMRLIGQSFSMGVAMMAISIYIGSAQMTAEAHEQLTASLKMTFAVSAFFCIIGVYLSSIRNGRKKR